MNSAALLAVYLHLKIIGYNGHAIIIDAKHQLDIAWHDIGFFSRTKWGNSRQQHCNKAAKPCLQFWRRGEGMKAK